MVDALGGLLDSEGTSFRLHGFWYTSHRGVQHELRVRRLHIWADVLGSVVITMRAQDLTMRAQDLLELVLLERGLSFLGGNEGPVVLR